MKKTQAKRLSLTLLAAPFAASWLVCHCLARPARSEEIPAPQTSSENQTANQPPAAPSDSDQNKDQDSAPERWNLFYQATSIGQYHGTFTSPYAGLFSLQDYPERDASLTTTLFFGLRLASNTQLYFDPEMAGGRGFSGVSGLANSSNGELPRVESATPKPYLARLYITQDFGFGDETESFDSDENQLAGTRPMTRYSITVGRFTLTDFFDNNRYSHDPRSQFMGWAVMYNGAWDYPADTRGYTWGWVHEFHTRNWSLRYASAFEPRVANGEQFDRRILEDRGDVFEGERRWGAKDHEGAVRVLNYENHADAGNYQEAVNLALKNGGTPDVIATRRAGTLKYGFGVSFDQQVSADWGVFGRLGWNDGKTESFAFTAIDRLATEGVSLNGRRWHRPNDQVATEVTMSGLSAVHAEYLALGGYDFLIGDGRLRYGPETIWESYYNARVLSWMFWSIDYQHVVNPAYNRDRGPVSIYSVRAHIEFGRETFQKKHQN
jgi:high affinity Mn2+ porin